jgi:PAS domain S-box-containing protein
MDAFKTYEQLAKENEELLWQLEEAMDTINAIRTGQVDALIVTGPGEEPQLYTLKTADQNYRVFIEKMNEGAVTLDEQGIIVYCNSMFSSVVGLPLSKIIGLSFETLVPTECLGTYRDIFERGWYEDGKTEISILNGGVRVPCQLSVTTLQLDEGRALSVIITDLTFQKDIQQLLKLNNQQLAAINAELETSNHDLQQFASVASHDLQEPLRKILIFSTFLRDKHQDEFSAESTAYLNKIIASSERMRSMIVDILGYSRLSTNASTVMLTNLHEVVREVLEDYEILIQEKGATIVVESLPEIEANRGQMKQVFQNLISNSIKFSKPEVAPVITITSEYKSETSDAVELENQPATCSIIISDNGIGFSDQYRDKIFSLFERLNTKDKYEGSGIGLAITKKIIDKHNGIISATSEEGQGSQFIITLPLRQKSA